MLLLSGGSNNVYSNEQFQEVIVADPYVDVYTGHGNSYPVFHIIERGETIEIIFRHTSWFKIKNKEGIEGWVKLEQMTKTLSPDNHKQIELQTFSHEDYVDRRWEAGLLGGRFGSADALTIYAAYLFNKSLAVELSDTEIIGNTSSSSLYKLAIIMQPFPTLAFSPYVMLGTGFIETTPKTTLVLPKDNRNQFGNFGLGVQTYLSKRIILKIEYSDFVIFSANKDYDSNEDLKEWKAGFAIFF
ncbi:MAG: SH3 domain-containing protein [Gammaproteobacteria bacterium]|nr:SH3 domain-containing protein [Gammaproteobacteria bacterium]